MLLSEPLKSGLVLVSAEVKQTLRPIETRHLRGSLVKRPMKWKLSWHITVEYSTSIPLFLFFLIVYKLLYFWIVLHILLQFLHIL